MRTLTLYLALVLAALALSACAKKTPEPVTYTIEMTEYAFTPNTLELKVGQQVTLVLVNKGALKHEIMFGREVRMVNNRPSGYMQDMFEESGVEPQVSGAVAEEEEEEHGGGFMVALEKTGDQATITFTVTKDMVGEWEMGCFEQEGVHYEAGMKGKVVVSP
jgi:uncharacterized cupredoxin-like copper-binding protein